MADLVKWGKDRLKNVKNVATNPAAAVAQINPLDGNRTYKTVQQQGRQFSPNPNQSVKQQIGTQASRVGTGIGLGGVRSGVGAAQGFSGLYDLASPGKGTNRLSKKLDSAARFVDQTARNEGVVPSYKVGQFGADALTFATGAGLAKAASKAPAIAKKIAPVQNVLKPIDRKITQATNKLATKGTSGRIAATTVKGTLNPANNAANVAMTAKLTGENASKGRDTSPKTVATDLAVGTAFNVGLPLAGAVIKEGARASVPAVKSGAKTAKTVKYTVDKTDPNVRELDRQYNDLNVRWQKASIQGRKDIDGAIKANRQHRDDITRPGAGLGTRKVSPTNPGSPQPNIPPRPLSGQVDGKAISGKPVVPSYDSTIPPTMYPDALERVFAENPTLPKAVSLPTRPPMPPQVPTPRLSQNRLVQTADGQVNNPQQTVLPERLIPTTNKVNSLPDTIPQKTDNVQLRISDSTAAFSNEQTKIVKEYGDMLRSMGEGNGVAITTTGARISNNFRSPEIKGINMTKAAWYDKAESDLRSGKADPYIQKEFDKLNDPEFRSLVQSQEGATAPGTIGDKFTTDPLEGFRVKIKGSAPEKQVTVKKVETDGRQVKKTDVKTGREERYIIDDNGDLIKDSKGAYRIFKNDKDELTEIRIGDEVYSAKDIGDLTKINNYGSTMATQRRNIERAIPDEKTRNKVLELTVDHQQHQATKMIERHAALKSGMQDIADDLGISFGIGRKQAKRVSAAIQNYGEKSKVDGKVYDIPQLIEDFGELKAASIIKADMWFRKQYDTLLDEMNTTLTRYGYDPVPKRNDYYTHFSEPTLFEKFGLKMQEVNDALGSPSQEANPTGGRASIPNALAGESEYLTPNKKFNQFTLRRKGEQHTADAFQSFEKYINPTLNNIYMTPSITRARVISKAIAMENDRIGKDVNQVVVQLREWANHLAGKSNRLGDRQAADTAGLRQMLQVSNWIQKKVGGNAIVGNFATALIQPIVLAQTAGKAGYKNTLLAFSQEASSSHSATAAIRKSEFLKRRYTDLTPVTAGKSQRGSNVAGTPLRVIEQTAGRVTWQANYNKALEKGLKGDRAIKFADIEAEKTMAGRAIGEKPELYRSKSAGAATQFMLEVNNYIQQVAKDMTPTQAAKTFVAAYGINLLIQEATGRSIGFNPIDAAVDSMQTLADDDKSGGKKAKEIAQRWGGEAIGNVPVASNVIDTFASDDQVKKFFGNSTPIGRYGVGSTYGSLFDNTVGKVLQGKPLEAGAYAAAPWGYSQASKTVKGVSAVAAGKLTDKDGKTTVEIPQTPGNFVRGALFGPSAIKEVNQYYNNIGVKKEDQKEVQNQTSGVASKQGLQVISNPGNPSTADEQLRAAFSNSPERKKFLSLKNEEQKSLASTNPEYRKMYDEKKSIEKTFKTPELRVAGLSDESNKLLDKYDRFTPGGKSKFDSDIRNKIAYEKATLERDQLEGKLTPEQKVKRETYNDKLEYAEQNGVKDPLKVDELFEEPKHKFVLKLSEYEEKRKTAEYKDSPDDFKDQEELVKLNVLKDYSKKAANIFGMSASNIDQYLDRTGGTDEQTWKELVALDAAMTNAGLQKYSKLSSRSGKGGRGRKAKLPSTESLNAATKIPNIGKIKQARITTGAVRTPNFKKPRKSIPKIAKNTAATPKITRLRA